MQRGFTTGFGTGVAATALIAAAVALSRPIAAPVVYASSMGGWDPIHHLTHVRCNDGKGMTVDADFVAIGSNGDGQVLLESPGTPAHPYGPTRWHGLKGQLCYFNGK